MWVLSVTLVWSAWYGYTFKTLRSDTKYIRYWQHSSLLVHPLLNCFLFVHRGPISSMFWSALLSTRWRGCLILFLPNSSHQDPKRWLNQKFYWADFFIFTNLGTSLRRLIWMLWFPVVQVVTAVMWNKPDSPFPVPVWIIILAILAGLLLLSLLIYLLYKVTSR